MSEKTKRYPAWALICPLLGVLLSSYALYVEYRHEQDSSYEAMCDFNEKASCSKVFTSEMGKFFSYIKLVPKDSIFDQPNALYGILTYLFILMLMRGLFIKNSELTDKFLFAISLASLAFSVILAYHLFFVLQDFCVVCVSIYCCNIGIFFTIFPRLFRKEKVHNN